MLPQKPMLRRFAVLSVVAVSLSSFSCEYFGSSKSVGEAESSWAAKNAITLKKYDLKTRDRVLPEVNVPPSVLPGKVYELGELTKINLADGVSATVSWGRGALLELVTMKPGAAYPEQTLGEELITYVEDGLVTCDTGSGSLELGKDAVLYLTPGTKRSLKAGPEGAKLIEVYSPVRRDHLALAGVELPPGVDVEFPDQGVTPSLEAGKVYNLNQIQMTGLTPPDGTKPYTRSTAQARLVWGKNAMLSFVRMDPGTSFPWHIHPEDQHMIALRGALEEGVMGEYHRMDGEKRHVLLQPGGMAHSAKLSEFGADALDVFWPVRPDYIEKATKQNVRYREVIAEGEEAKKLAEGFVFAEGGVWKDGALYFTDMYFEPDWTGDPKRSRLVKLTLDGKADEFAKGMQMNGTILAKNGNFIVCDMFGNRVIEMDSKTGEVVKTLLSEVNGKPIDGPNDLVMDSKGGIYVSDPQFTPAKEKSQPGKQVYYLAPDGSAKVVIPAGELAFPNGVGISPDGKTFYVDNTWFSPGDNFVWAYDIAADGTLSGKRQFAALNLTGEILSAEDPAARVDSRADGMAIDTEGRIYVTSLSGVQIFDKDGLYVGTVWCPQNPANCAFGGPNGDILFMVGGTSAWAVKTKAKGFAHPK